MKERPTKMSIPKRAAISLACLMATASFASTDQAKPADKASDAVQYTCADGKAISAKYSKSAVTLVLNDKRKLKLNQSVSGSGTRYTNKDETLVFWSKGNSARLEEKGDSTFNECTATD